MTGAPAQPLKAAAWMFGAIVSFTLMAIGGRAAQAELNTFELMFWRSLIGFVLIVLLIRVRTGSLETAKTGQWRLHLTRNVFHFAGQNLWFYGLIMLPLSQLVALEFTMPIWVVLLAPLFLPESLTPQKLMITLIGFIGVLVVAQPGIQPLNSGHLAGMLAAVGFAINLIFTRKIMRFDPVLCVLFWMTLSQCVMALILSLTITDGFTWPSSAMIPWLVIVAVTGLTAHFSLTTALGLAPAMQVAPMEFARLPIITLVGLYLYSEPLDPFVFLGAAIIFSANLWNLRTGSATTRKQG